MTSIYYRIKSHFAHWREWELNPVVVKELRQSVRSWAVTGVLLLFLLILFFTAMGFLVGQTLDPAEDQWLGGRVFQAFLLILTLASIAFIPLYVGIRLAGERQEANLDLLYVTSLTPQRIIRGKFLCGAYMAVLFFSACMPFMVFTNLLRGIDLPTIFFILACLFLMVCAAIQVAIFLACLPISRLLKILVALFGTFVTLSMARGLTMVFSEMASSGIGSTMGSRDFWNGFLTSTSLVIAGVMMLYFLSVALISPLSANRALPLRSYVTALWLFGAALALYWAWKEHDTSLLMVWAIPSFILLIGSLLIVISNVDLLSLRVRREIPAHRTKRALAFLFYNGAAGGLVWLALLLSVTFCVCTFIFQWDLGVPGAFGTFSNSMSRENFENFEFIGGAVVLYAFDYALTALFLHRKIFGHRFPRLPGIMAVLLPSAWALVPNIVSFFFNRLSWTRLEQCQLGNIFNVFMVKDHTQKQMHLICAAVWLLVMIALNLNWFRRQVQHFQPLHTQAQPPIIGENPAPPPVAAV